MKYILKAELIQVALMLVALVPIHIYHVHYNLEDTIPHWIKVWAAIQLLPLFIMLGWSMGKMVEEALNT